MSYCTQTDLEKKIDPEHIIALTDDGDTGSVDASVVAEAIADADAEIDAYCGKRYPVPFTTVPTMVKKLSRDIAIYNLCQRRQQTEEGRQTDYDNAIKFLQSIAKGLATLGEDDPDGTPSEVNEPDITSDTRLFSRDGLKGF
ncbi:MAG: hypothetical protein CR984_02055 [Proteobacteria bacterium]|nr:MAG: hypothetical protein CR984_02055 [Pseudomonadota bacterium]